MYFGGPIPWIAISDGTREAGKYLTQTKEGLTPAGAERSRWLSRGTLILSNSGTVCVPKILGIDGCIHDGFLAIQKLSLELDRDFLFWWFEWVRDKVRNENRQGNTQVNLNTGIVKALEIALPALAEQRRIVAEIERRLSIADRMATEVMAGLSRCSRLRQSILRAAFEGRLVPQDPSDEPASVLLDRIHRDRMPANVLPTARRKPTATT
jgi:type I restriction enzyme, S subunit